MLLYILVYVLNVLWAVRLIIVWHRKRLTRRDPPVIVGANITTSQPLDEFLIENLMFPLKVEVCGNSCGCVMLHTPGEIVYFWQTTDSYYLMRGRSA